MKNTLKVSLIKKNYNNEICGKLDKNKIRDEILNERLSHEECGNKEV